MMPVSMVIRTQSHHGVLLSKVTAIPCVLSPSNCWSTEEERWLDGSAWQNIYVTFVCVFLEVTWAIGILVVLETFTFL